MQKNDVINAEIIDFSSDGFGIAKIDGYVVFVKGGVLGDKLKIKLLKLNKNYGFGKIIQIIHPSYMRINPACKSFLSCGGCSFLNIDYKYELEYKKQKVKNALKKTAGIEMDFDIIGADDIYHYRNKAIFPIRIQNGNVESGFFMPASHIICKNTDCKTQPEIFKEILQSILSFINKNNVSVYEEKTCKGVIKGVFFRKSDYEKKVMVCLIVNAKSVDFEKDFSDFLTKKHSEISSIFLNFNQDNSNTLLSNDFKKLWGEDYLIEELLNKRFKISPKSFFQINTNQAQKLYSTVLDFAKTDKTDIVVDLYCGTGTIGLCTAFNAKNLYGIEIIDSAVQDAKENAKLNGIENAKFYTADAFNGTKLLREKKIKPSIVIIDPPRKGSDNKTLDLIKDMAPDKLIYVSCNCATLARDIKYLEGSFKLEKIMAVDMFPRTPHVESVALLKRISN